MAKATLLFTLAACLLGLSFAVRYKDCGSTVGRVKDVIIEGCDESPICKLKKGTNVTFTVDFTSLKTATKLTAVVHGKIAGVPVPFPLDNPNACKNSNLQCPLKPKTSYTYKTAIYVKALYPQVKVIVEWEIKNENSEDVFCIEVPAEIVDGNK